MGAPARSEVRALRASAQSVAAKPSNSKRLYNSKRERHLRVPFSFRCFAGIATRCLSGLRIWQQAFPPGAPLGDCPPYVTDYAVEVRAHGDHFGGSVDEDAPAVELAGETLTGAQLVAAGEGTPPGARVLTTASYATRAGLIQGLVGPFTAHGSVIICQNLEQSRLDRRISLEHATAVIDDSGPTHPTTRPSL